MGHELRRFDSEGKILGHLIGPGLERLRLLERVKRAVDLDRGDLPARVLELLLLRDSFRVKGASPGGVNPAGHAYADLPMAKAMAMAMALFHAGRAFCLRHRMIEVSANPGVLDLKTSP